MSPRSRSGDATGRAEAFFEMDAAEFGSPDVFAIECAMYRDSHETEISMFIEGRNILEFELDGRKHTACWNFDELTSWLRHFLETMEEDPYPAACSSRYAAGKDTESRNFDSDNEEVLMPGMTVWMNGISGTDGILLLTGRFLRMCILSSPEIRWKFRGTMRMLILIPA